MILSKELNLNNDYGFIVITPFVVFSLEKVVSEERIELKSDE
jgi:hypothetical protein